MKKTNNKKNELKKERISFFKKFKKEPEVAADIAEAENQENISEYDRPYVDAKNEAILERLNPNWLTQEWITIMTNLKLYNLYKDTFGINFLEKTNYGFKCELLIPAGLSFADLEKNISKIEDRLKCIMVIRKQKRDNLIECEFIFIQPSEKPFRVIEGLKPYEIYIGDSYDGSPIILSLVKYPNILISGGVRSGKSKMTDCVLTNMIYNTTKENFNLWLCQVAKSDLIAYEDVEQCKGFATTLEESIAMMEQLEEEIDRRVKLIKPMRKAFKGDNYADYNKLHPKEILPTTIVAFDETSSLFCTKGDDKATIALKSEIVKHMLRIAQFGGGLGIYLLVSLQRPTADNLNPFIKAMSTITVSLRQNNTKSSEVAIDDSNAAIGLRQREFVYRTEGEYEYGIVPMISNECIHHYLNKKIIIGHGEDLEQKLKAYMAKKEQEEANKPKGKTTMKDINFDGMASNKPRKSKKKNKAMNFDDDFDFNDDNND